MTHLSRSRACACLWLAAWDSGHICSVFLGELSKSKWGQLSLEQKLSGVKREVCALASYLDQTSVSFPGVRNRGNTRRQPFLVPMGVSWAESWGSPTAGAEGVAQLLLSWGHRADTQGRQQSGISAVPGDSLHTGLSSAQEEEKGWHRGSRRPTPVLGIFYVAPVTFSLPSFYLDFCAIKSC